MPSFSEPGRPVDVAAPNVEAEVAALEAQIDATSEWTTSDLSNAYPVRFGTELGYDPATAQNLDLIQASELALDASELEKLGSQGFVIVPRQAFPHVAYGYETIYAFDLPVYVTLDAIMETVHLSYDAVLKGLEREFLMSDLRVLLTDARNRLREDSIFASGVATDLDLYFAVALSLLDGSNAAPVAGADAAEITALVAQATEANGISEVQLFGAMRSIDFSQFEPRGHYSGDPALEAYFRAMIWLGRTDFRLIETLGDGTILFRREQFDAVRALHGLVQGAGRDAYDVIDAVLTAFVGEHDSMHLAEVDDLIEELGGPNVDFDAMMDQEIAETIVTGSYGAQRIASQVIYREPDAPPGPLPLHRSFALLGQRYVVDSHVFSEVVFDRVPEDPVAGPRKLPDPLDAAFAALGNDAALPLLAEELDRFGYAPQLARIRTLVDAHGDDYWEGSLYTDWLSALRAMSPSAELEADEGLPSVARTEAWARRVLGAQLASWAELRHDTILYAKQSYSAGIACEFPDGYVDPYPDA